MRIRNHVPGPYLLPELGPTGPGDNFPRSFDPLNIPEGWTIDNGVWKKTTDWQDYDGSGIEFYNTNPEFRLRWLDQHHPDPRYKKTDLDLVIDGWPAVEDPFSFNDPLIYTEDYAAGSEAMDLPAFAILPFTYSENMTIDETRHVRGFVVDLPGTDSNGMKMWADETPEHLLPIRATRWGRNYNLTREDEVDGFPLLAAPYTYGEFTNRENIRGNINSLGSDLSGVLGVIDLLQYQFDDIDWTTLDVLMDSFTMASRGRFGRVERNYEKFPIVGIDATWDDGIDLLRGTLEQAHQGFWPALGQGRALIDDKVDGLVTSGNEEQMWIDPYQVTGLPSQQNFCRLFREVCTCYDPSQCPNLAYADDIPATDEDIYPGFSRNVYAGLDGQAYCRYKRRPPAFDWLSYDPDSNLDLQWFKFMDVPRRAVEWAGHYKLLCIEILEKFRNGGRAGVLEASNIQITECIDSDVSMDGRAWLVAVKNNTTATIGQYNYEMDPSSHQTIPAGTPIFWYSNAHPDDDPASSLENHLASRVFARIWYVDENDDKQSAIVELFDNYIVPTYRETCFYTVGNMEGGFNPQLRDLATRGIINGGMRKYYEYFFNELTGIPHWRLSLQERDINPRGFTVIDGNDGDPTWIAGRDADEGKSAIGKQFMQIEDARARGNVAVCGYPGEVIDKKMMFWTGHVHPRKAHIQELYYKLYNPLFDGRTLDVMNWGDPFFTYTCANQINKEMKDIYGNVLDPSEIITIQMIQSARNMVLPMRFIELGSKIPTTPHEQDWTVARADDFTTRKGETVLGQVQRHGFYYPSCFCYMRQTKNNLDIEDQWIQKASFDGLKRSPYTYIESPTGRTRLQTFHKIKRVYYPNSAKWWFDNGLIGCGLETGDPANTHAFGTWPRYGNGFVQQGTAGFSLWNKWVPSDKEVVAAYLCFRPSTACHMSPKRESVGMATSGMTRFVPGNNPFENQWYPDTSHDADVAILNRMQTPVLIGYELYAMGDQSYAFYGAEDNTLSAVRQSVREAFDDAEDAVEEVMGEFDFYASGVAGRNTAPAGNWGYDRLFWFPYNYAKTASGLRLDSRVFVNGDYIGTVRSRALEWYTKFYPMYKQGTHTQDRFFGLWSRNDMDEPGIDASDGGKGKGYGFACGHHLGGWAYYQRLFNITDAVRKAFLKNRADTTFLLDLDTPEQDFEPTNIAALEVQPNAPKNAPSDSSLDPTNEYLLYETRTLAQRHVASRTYPAVPSDTTIFDNEIPVDPDDIVPWNLYTTEGEGEEAYIQGLYGCLVIDLKNRRATTGMQAAVDLLEYGGTLYEEMEDEALVTDVQLVWEEDEESGIMPPEQWSIAISGQNPYQDNRFCTIEVTGSADTGLPHDLSSLSGFPARYIIIRAKGPAALQQVKVLGYGKLPKQVPITGYPMASKFTVADLHHTTGYGDVPLYVLPCDPPMSKPYAVQMRLVNVYAMHIDAFDHNAPTCVNFTCIGYFDPLEPPRITWENGYPIAGEFAIDPGTGDIIIESMRRFNGRRVGDVDTQFEFEELNGQIADAPSHYTVANQMGGYEIAIIYGSIYGSVADAYIKTAKTGPHSNVLADSIVQISEGTALSLVEAIPDNQWIHDLSGAVFEHIPFSVNNDTKTWGGGKRNPEFPAKMRSDDNVQQTIDGSSTDGRNNPWKDKVYGEVRFRGEPFVRIYGGTVIAPAQVQQYDEQTGLPLSNGLALAGFNKYDMPNGGVLGGDIVVQMIPDARSAIVPIDDQGSAAYNKFRKKQVAFEPVIYLSLRERSKVYQGQTTFGISTSEGG